MDPDSYCKTIEGADLEHILVQGKQVTRVTYTEESGLEYDRNRIPRIYWATHRYVTFYK